MRGYGVVRMNRQWTKKVKKGQDRWSGNNPQVGGTTQTSFFFKDRRKHMKIKLFRTQ
jgi:hypothetical protein